MDEGKTVILLSQEIYDKEAVFAAAYSIIDRFNVDITLFESC